LEILKLSPGCQIFERDEGAELSFKTLPKFLLRVLPIQDFHPASSEIGFGFSQFLRVHVGLSNDSSSPARSLHRASIIFSFSSGGSLLSLAMLMAEP
jgi:hypothetical protein